MPVEEAQCLQTDASVETVTGGVLMTSRTRMTVPLSPSINGALPMRDCGAYQPRLDRKSEQYGSHPSIAVLSTAGDSTAEWLRAAMGRTTPPR